MDTTKIAPVGGQTKPLEKKQNNIQSQNGSIDSLDSFVKAHFNCVSGFNNISDAQIIMLGENHLAPTDGIFIEDLINKLAKDGDVILLEGFKSGQVVSKNDCIHNFRANVLVMGWDNLAEHGKAVGMVRKLWDLYHQIASEKNPAKRASLDKKFWELKTACDRVTLLQRNASLIRTICGAPRGKKVFVIAGSLHFDPKNLNPKTSLGTSKYTILIAKHKGSVSLEQSEAYFTGRQVSTPQSVKAQDISEPHLPKLEFQTSRQVNKTPTNYVFEIKYASGKLESLGIGWFTDAKKTEIKIDDIKKSRINIGDTVYFNESGDLEMFNQNGLRSGTPCKILGIVPIY